MKKNVFGCSLVLVLIFGFIGCGGDNTGTTTYTVTFDSNGGSDVGTITGIISGATITLPSEPTKKNNVFSGWFTDNDTFQNPFTSSTIITEDVIVFAQWKTSNNEIQVYNSDGTSFIGNDTGNYWFSKVLPDTEPAGHKIAGTVTIENGKLISFSLPEIIDDQYLDTGLNYGDASSKGGNLIIKLQSGNMLRLYSENAWGVYNYSNAAATGVTIGGVSGSMNIKVGWNYCSLVEGDTPTISTVENFDGYKWTRITP